MTLAVVPSTLPLSYALKPKGLALSGADIEATVMLNREVSSTAPTGAAQTYYSDNAIYLV